MNWLVRWDVMAIELALRPDSHFLAKDLVRNPKTRDSQRSLAIAAAGSSSRIPRQVLLALVFCPLSFLGSRLTNCNAESWDFFWRPGCGCAVQEQTRYGTLWDLNRPEGGEGRPYLNP
jgi:hypothetical protein